MLGWVRLARFSVGLLIGKHEKNSRNPTGGWQDGRRSGVRVQRNRTFSTYVPVGVDAREMDDVAMPEADDRPVVRYPIRSIILIRGATPRNGVVDLATIRSFWLAQENCGTRLHRLVEVVPYRDARICPVRCQAAGRCRPTPRPSTGDPGAIAHSVLEFDQWLDDIERGGLVTR